MARSFNGTSDVVVTTASGVLGTAARSVSLWFNTTDARGASTNFVFSYGTNAAASQFVVTVESGVIGCRCFGTLGLWGSGYNDGKWHHVLLTFPSGGTMSQMVCYVDGILLSGTFTSGSTALNTGNTLPVYIGQFSAAGGGYYSGKVAEVGVWNVQLVADEAKGLAQGRLPRGVRPGSLQNYWPLWGLQSPEPDLSGSANYGGLIGTSATNHAPVTLFTRKARDGGANNTGSAVATGSGSTQATATIVASSVQSGSGSIQGSAATVASSVIAATGGVDGTASVLASSIVAAAGTVSASAATLASSITAVAVSIDGTAAIVASSTTSAAGGVSATATATASTGGVGAGTVAAGATTTANSVVASAGNVAALATTVASNLTSAAGTVSATAVAVVGSTNKITIFLENSTQRNVNLTANMIGVTFSGLDEE